MTTPTCLKQDSCCNANYTTGT